MAVCAWQPGLMRCGARRGRWVARQHHSVASAPALLRRKAAARAGGRPDTTARRAELAISSQRKVIGCKRDVMVKMFAPPPFAAQVTLNGLEYVAAKPQRSALVN